ncbi:MAG: hypothetical protein HFI30_02110 [Lachnospiraceae bacterium]|nr:hypothetical protein [Lachnospiraceae bacterium]
MHLSLLADGFGVHTKACLIPNRDSDGSMISIDCTAVEDEVAHTIRQRSELDWLVYHDPIGFADLILNGDPEQYLKDITKRD